MYVTMDQPIRTGAMSAYPYSEWLESLYTFESAFEMRRCVERCGRATRCWFHGRACRMRHPKRTFGRSVSRIRSPSRSCPGMTSRNCCAAKSVALLQDGRSHIFEAPTGWGKTVVGGVIAARVGQPTLIVVTKEDLMHQWRDSLTQVLGISPPLIGADSAGHVRLAGQAVCAGHGAESDHPGQIPSRHVPVFRAEILDEVHQMAAECFVRSCQLFPAKLRLGFSATPTRKDGKTQVIALAYWADAGAWHHAGSKGQGDCAADGLVDSDTSGTSSGNRDG